MTVEKLEVFAQSFKIQEDGCWIWQKYIAPNGYGRFWTKDEGINAHRLLFQEVNNLKLHKDEVCDHLCRVRSCVNPKHIEVVSRGENVLRGVGHAPVNLTKNSCPKGHLYDETNTLITKRKNSKTRHCRECMKEVTRAWYKLNGREWHKNYRERKRG